MSSEVPDAFSATQESQMLCREPIFFQHTRRLLARIHSGAVPADEGVFQPPISRFHPVPTRPVFAPKPAEPELLPSKGRTVPHSLLPKPMVTELDSPRVASEGPELKPAVR